MSQEIKKGQPSEFVFEKQGYMIVLAGIVMIIVGFALMSGGGSDDPAVFNPEIFSFRRITLAPTVVMTGFALQIYAIMRRPKG
ncbi:MAG: DUF3098 domain-containing protein [Flavobacteriales bacterium]|nr:DUF3098 domain-containing protein [Flavobacteriales bacterium]